MRIRRIYWLPAKPGCNRIEAAVLLHENDQKEGLPILLKELKGDDPDLVLRTSRALELLGPKAKPPMKAVLAKWRKSGWKDLSSYSSNFLWKPPWFVLARIPAPEPFPIDSPNLT